MPPAQRTRQLIPFSVADELNCYYDAPAEPCTVHLELAVPGHLEEKALRLAVGAALAAGPRAMVRRAAGGWWRHGSEWEQPDRLDVDPVAATAWADEDELGRVRSAFLNSSPALDSSPPLRILLASGPGEDRVILNVHHAALDGISCLELLRAVARHYREAAAPAVAPPAAALAVPGPPDSTTAPAHQAQAQAAHAPAALQPASVLPRPATRIAPDRQGSGRRGGRPGYGFRLLRLPVPVINDQRQGPRPTVNDLLIVALMVAVGRWNSSHGRSPGRIRITMPINTRPPGQAGATGNLSRLTAVTAFPSAGHHDLATLAEDVAAQTRWAKDHAGPQVDPLSRARAQARCPAGVKRWLLRLALRTAGPLVCDTSLVSNLGLVAEPPRFGQAEACGMWFSTSAHMPRGLSVGAIGMGGQLHLCLRYRRALFSEPAASEFARAYTAALSDVSGLDVTDLLSRDITSQGSPA
jgi:NRPS condensation-like uncharacterized protein